MPRVDFYVLPPADTADQFACVMAQKAWQQGHSIYLHATSSEQAARMDDLLWTFRDISFLPHQRADGQISVEVPVTIGWEPGHAGQQDVLINLSDTIPQQAENFSRIIEIVSGNETERDIARHRYRDYRQRGYELHNHTIGSENDYAS